MSLVLQWILGSSGTAILIIILRYFLHKNIKATWVYILWLVLLVRLLCPFLPSSSLSFLNPIQEYIDNQIIPVKENSTIQTYNIMSEQQSSINETLESKISQGTDKNIPDNKEIQSKQVRKIDRTSRMHTSSVLSDYSFIQWKPLLMLIWGIGSLGMFFYYFVGAYLLYKKSTKLEAIKESHVIALYERCKCKLKFSHPIQLYWADRPMSYGVIKKYITLPKGYAQEALENMIMHELMHHKRQDLMVNILIAISLMIHWFNPIIWFALYLMRQDAELACDERVIEILKNKQVYAITLLKLTDRQQVQYTIGSYMGISKKQLKRRILAMDKRKKRGTIVGSLMGMCIIVLALICLTGTKANNQLVISNPNALSREQVKSGTIWNEINKIQFENSVQHVELSPDGKNAYVLDDEPSLVSSEQKDKLYIVSQNGQISKDILGVAKEVLEKELNMENVDKYRILEQNYGWDKEMFKLDIVATGGDGRKNGTAKKSHLSLAIDPQNIEDIDVEVSTNTVGKAFKLSQKEQEAYEAYIKTKDVQVLKELSSIETAKIIHALKKERKNEEAYELLITSNSKEQYLVDNARLEYMDDEQLEYRYNTMCGLLDEGVILPTKRKDNNIIQTEMIVNDYVDVVELEMEKLDGVWRMVWSN